MCDSINAAKYTREQVFVDLRQAVAVLTSELDRTVSVLVYSFACSKKSVFSFFTKSIFYLGSTVQCNRFSMPPFTPFLTLLKLSIRLKRHSMIGLRA